MTKTTKSNKEGFDLEKARWYVLNSFINVEKELDRVIIDYIDAHKDKTHFVASILLNSSIINFRSKVKLLKNIFNAKDKNLDEKCISSLYRMNNLRNAFAHCKGNKHVQMRIWGSSIDGETIKVDRKFNVMKSDWSIDYIDISEGLMEFRQLYEEFLKVKF